ncbi:MAG: preprotein translocase subunit TatC [Chloroflexi bacterium]|nr:preprotein translocase subunit TatC [Chloroflexota bacterium]
MRGLLRALWWLLTSPLRLLAWMARGIAEGWKTLSSEDPEDTPIGETVQKAVENPGDLLVHLAALRGHLLRSAVALILVAGFVFVYSSQLLDWLAAPIGGISELQAIEVTEPIGVIMRVTLITAFAVTLPYISLELLLFAAPGLSRRARITGLLAIPLVAIFFLGGMAFTYYYILPEALPFLLGFMGIPTLVRPSSYIAFATGLMFWIGVAFEFPLVAYVLAAMGILPARLLRAQWRIAVVLLSVLAAAITPTIDPINMLLVWVPLVLLYFMSVGTASLAEGQRRARLKKKGLV